MKVRFIKTHKDAIKPQRAHQSDSGYDIYCVEDFVVEPGKSVVVPTGLIVGSVERGYWFKIEARSGLGFKHNIYPHPGIIDNSYRGQLDILLRNVGNEVYYGKKGDRIAQIVFYPIVNADVVLDQGDVERSDRGDKGFGSSGR